MAINPAARQRGVVLSIVAFALLVYLVAWSPLLTVRSLEVIGLPTSVSSETILRRSDLVLGEKLARIEPRSVAQSLESITWIKSADISRNWITGKVVIDLHHREAIGIFHGRAIDKDGTLFSYPGKLSTSLPIVSAPTTELGLEAIALFRQLPADLQSSISSISAGNASSIASVHQMPKGLNLRVMWGDNRDIALKIKVLQALLALPENASVKRVDLSAPHAPIVK